MAHDAPTASPGASPLDAALTMRRGPAGWQLSSTRRAWAGPLLRGREALDAERLLPALYSLCGGAHRLAARHALAAARGEAAGTATDGSPAAASQALRIDTLREHLRRLWLDGPRWLAGARAGQGPGDPLAAAEAASVLTGCAYFGPPGAGGRLDDTTMAAGRRWLQQHVFGTDAGNWLAAWQRDPVAAARDWSTFSPASAQAQPWPARWLAGMRWLIGPDVRVPSGSTALRAAGDGTLRLQLAQALRADADFVLAPTLPLALGGGPAETGGWTRAADPHARPGSPAYEWLWMRHAARLAEVAHLSGPKGEHWLAQGALSIDTHEGLGWCEMARGLLLHWVRLDALGRIADYRVLAPTEWNFHPQGGAARLLAEVLARPGPLDLAQARAVAAAYDPCVELRIDTEQAPEPAASEARDA